MLPVTIEQGFTVLLKNLYKIGSNSSEFKNTSKISRLQGYFKHSQRRKIYKY